MFSRPLAAWHTLSSVGSVSTEELPHEHRSLLENHLRSLVAARGARVKVRPTCLIYVYDLGDDPTDPPDPTARLGIQQKCWWWAANSSEPRRWHDHHQLTGLDSDTYYRAMYDLVQHRVLRVWVDEYDVRWVALDPRPLPWGLDPGDEDYSQMAAMRWALRRRRALSSEEAGRVLAKSHIEGVSRADSAASLLVDGEHDGWAKRVGSDLWMWDGEEPTGSPLPNPYEDDEDDEQPVGGGGEVDLEPRAVPHPEGQAGFSGLDLDRLPYGFTLPLL